MAVLLRLDRSSRARQRFADGLARLAAPARPVTDLDADALARTIIDTDTLRVVLSDQHLFQRADARR